MAEVVKIQVLNQTDLDKLLSTDPKMEQMLRSCIKKVISNARKGAVMSLKGKVGQGYKHSNGDPRAAYKAVKSMVYKRELGGNISILNKRRASNVRISGQKGMNAYYGSDRGFVLRFLNSGTPGRPDRYGKIKSSRIFSDVGEKYIHAAVEELNKMVNEKIEIRSNQI